MTMQRAITPGEEWLDTEGKPIQAHGGSVMAVGDAYYWYGENKERTDPETGIWHWGMRCYRSTDLVNWEDLGLIVPPDVDDTASQLHPTQMADRPHILYNEATGLFVCWIKVMQADGGQLSTVLTAPEITGPYTVARMGFKPLGMDAGDFDLVVDPDSKRGYYIFEKVHTELIVADLTNDYTDVTGHYTSHFHRGHPPFVREAPAHFTRDGRHYLITSGTTGYAPNRSEVAVADDIHGPWTVLGDPHPDDATGRSFRTQVSSVFKHPHKELWIAVADRWLPDFDGDADVIHRLFDVLFDPASTDEDKAAALAAAPPPPVENTAEARYVWLPIEWRGEVPTITWHDAWSPDTHLSHSSQERHSHP